MLYILIKSYIFWGVYSFSSKNYGTETWKIEAINMLNSHVNKADMVKLVN